MSEPRTLRLSEDAHIEDFGDEAVVLELRTEEVFVLNGSGLAFLHAIMATNDLATALDSAAAGFGLSADAIAADFDTFCNAMVERHILVRAP